LTNSRHCLRVIRFVLNISVVCTDTGTTAKTSVTSMDQEKVGFSWIISAAVDRKAHWMTAITYHGANTTVSTQRMCQLLAVFQRQLYWPVSILAWYMLRSWNIQLLDQLFHRLNVTQTRT